MSDFWSTLREDAARYISIGPHTGTSAWLRLIALNPGFQLVLSIRLQSALAAVPLVGRPLRKIVWYFTAMYFGCEIDPKARFGPGLLIPHPIGIIIGPEWCFGRNATILQHVTFGRTKKPKGDCLVGDNVTAFAGSKIIGDFSIGHNVRIGANSVVIAAIPSNTTAVGVPAKYKSHKRKKRP